MEETAGAKLKKLRLEKGISLEEAHKKTKIHLNILKSIEGDAITNVNPVYLKGFLKIYCGYLGVEPKEYIPDFKEPRYPLTRTPQEKGALNESNELVTFLKASVAKFNFLEFSKRNKKSIAIVAAAFVAVLVVINVGKFIAHKRAQYLEKRKMASYQQRMSNPRAVAAKPASAATKAAVKPAGAVKEAAPAAVSTAAKEPVAPKKETLRIRLGVRARENCWVSLKADGKAVFQRVLEKGRYESWEAKDKMELSLGNAGAVELEVNGQLFTNLGRRGQARKNIVITKDGMTIDR